MSPVMREWLNVLLDCAKGLGACILVCLVIGAFFTGIWGLTLLIGSKAVFLLGVFVMFLYITWVVAMDRVHRKEWEGKVDDMDSNSSKL